MTLDTGSKLGPYEILAPIGAGGMGEVYRAKDPRVGREVAIKVSTEKFSERFEREARAVAALNHPNICTLYDVGPNYLVMELIEGPTLADRIKQGAIPLEESLEIARQIADALEAAHEKGIVHRDLKPANIKIRPDGTVKVLDFGLAKVAEIQAVSLSNSPTLSAAATQQGIILGTAAYMSPEQARGKPVDKRADIWAFGVVLCEMLTGKRLFEGDTVSDTLAAVLTRKPEWDRVPAKVRNLLRRCLEKDPKLRLRDIGDAWCLIDNATKPARPQRTVSVYVLGATALVFFLISAALWYRLEFFPSAPPPEVRFEIFPPKDGSFSGATDFGGTAFPWPQLSPDGKSIAFVATVDSKQMLWVRDFHSTTARVFPGTDNASRPFWSPDGSYLGFATQNLSGAARLKRVPIEGGPPQNICTVPNAVIDASWSTQNVILIGQNQGPLLRVPAGGGTPVPEGELNASRAEVALRFPDFLPDGHHYLFHAMSSDYRSSVFVGDLGSKERIELPGIQSQAKYSTTGHILFIRDLTLYAQPFDADRMQMKGDAFPVAEQVTSNPSGGSAAFSVSRNGGIAYRTTGSSTSGSQLAFFDRSGKQLGLAGPPDEYLNPELSPDCKFVAFNRGRPNDVWILDLEKNLPSRLRTKPDTRTRPLWGRNGRMIMFLGQAAGAGALLQSAFGMLSEESLIKKSNMAESMRIRLLDWSQDGQYLLYSEGSGSQSDLWVMPLMGDKKPFRIMDFQGLRTTITARISPDGHWLAINGYDTGRSEVYVQSFPKPEKRWPVSGSGGTMPRWRRDGKELFFVGDDQMLMSAAIQQQGTTIKTDIPKPLFKLNIIHAQGNPAFYEQYDVTQDNRFLVNSPPEQQSAVPITVILNWAAGLKK